eukprot:CAMPEP_0194449142 /NCGR_PEP_ID=MMETSP0176-20130528/129969_1 /TAXON_ID=216777 /ORGANISM="Proboscia alata, Strain PI-D3" /LENGTH=413 /DNA_ID=CAMNT_0039276219 /DNA_START=786 /DNA_END=2027 /DNA_ORIENTATION=-
MYVHGHTPNTKRLLRQNGCYFRAAILTVSCLAWSGSWNHGTAAFTFTGVHNRRYTHPIPELVRLPRTHTQVAIHSRMYATTTTTQRSAVWESQMETESVGVTQSKGHERAPDTGLPWSVWNRVRSLTSSLVVVTTLVALQCLPMAVWNRVRSLTSSLVVVTTLVALQCLPMATQTAHAYDTATPFSTTTLVSSTQFSSPSYETTLSELGNAPAPTSTTSKPAFSEKDYELQIPASTVRKSKPPYWDVMTEGDATAVSLENEQLLDNAVGNIVTFYYDNTAGANFSPRDFYNYFKFLRRVTEAASPIDSISSRQASDGDGAALGSKQRPANRKPTVQLKTTVENGGWKTVELGKKNRASRDGAKAPTIRLYPTVNTPPVDVFSNRENAVEGLKWLVVRASFVWLLLMFALLEVV